MGTDDLQLHLQALLDKCVEPEAFSFKFLTCLFDVEDEVKAGDRKHLLQALINTGIPVQHLVEVINEASGVGRLTGTTLSQISLKLMKALMRSILRGSSFKPAALKLPAEVKVDSDATSRVRIVYEEACKRWEVTSVQDGTDPDLDLDAVSDLDFDSDFSWTYLKQVKRVLKELEQAEHELGRCIHEIKKVKHPVATAYEHLLEVTQFAGSAVSRSRRLWHTLRRQHHLAAILQTARPATSLKSGDVSMLALLDISDARLTSRDRELVANVFAETACGESGDCFHAALESRAELGPRFLHELQRIGVVCPRVAVPPVL